MTDMTNLAPLHVHFYLLDRADSKLYRYVKFRLGDFVYVGLYIVFVHYSSGTHGGLAPVPPLR